MRPDSVQEASALLRGLERPVRPVGGGTKPWLPERGEEPLETGGLDRILEHNVGDFTAVLEAGVTFAHAQDVFAEHGQMLAWDPPAPEGATIGGIMATADSGPMRHRYGGVRDLVVGVTVVLSDGTIAKAGGKVRRAPGDLQHGAVARALQGAVTLPQLAIVLDDLAAGHPGRARRLLGRRGAGEAQRDPGLAVLVPDVERLGLERTAGEVEHRGAGVLGRNV